MASGTYELNDLATQATAHMDRQGRTVLTVTDSIDVVIVHLGERARAAILEALTPPVLTVGEINERLVELREQRDDYFDAMDAEMDVRTSSMAQHPKDAA